MSQGHGPHDTHSVGIESADTNDVYISGQCGTKGPVGTEWFEAKKETKSEVEMLLYIGRFTPSDWSKRHEEPA